METVVLDTDVFSFLLKGDTRAALYRSQLSGKRLAICFVTVAELYRWAIQKNWGAQRLAARLGPHPGDELAQQERHDKHAFRIREMSDRNDRESRASVGRAQHAGDVEGLAL